MPTPDGFTDGRYTLADTDSRGTRDPIALTSQVKLMRTGYRYGDHEPALILVMVADPERAAAVDRIRTALGDSSSRDDVERTDQEARP